MDYDQAAFRKRGRVKSEKMIRGYLYIYQIPDFDRSKGELVLRSLLSSLYNIVL